jgi:cysteine-rich repeat protein
VQDPPEDCELGDLHCNDNCKFEPYCGDGVINPELGEECDDGNKNDLDSCRNDCTLPKTTTTIVTTAVEFIIPVTGQFPLITAGIGHTCALTAKEGLECWGLNESGQVGDSTFEDKLEPVDVVGIDPSAVIGLVSGIHHTCVLTSANEVFCWGLNSSGQLGDGTTENRNEPILVPGLEGRIISISAGAEFTCALNDTDEVFCWGNNSSGQLNDGTEENSSIPMKSTTVSDPVQISGGSAELQGITSDGAVQLWNSQPIIPVTGLPNEDNAYVSADRFTDGGCSMTDTGDVNCWGGITDAQVKGALVNDMLSSGKGHACTMKTEGLVCWGSNSNGQLGDDSLNDTVEEVLVTELEQGVIALAAGMKHTCVIYEDETVVCWGLNDYGQLGNDTIDDSMVPVETK